MSNKPTSREIKEAIRKTEYEYFGDYAFSEGQREAVDILVRLARLWLRERGSLCRTDSRGYTLV